MFYITELVLNYFLGYVISCVVAKHTMWAVDCIAYLFSNYPPAQNQYMQEKILGNDFLREYMRGLYSHSREYRKIFLRRYFPSILQKMIGEFTRCEYMPPCIRTRANTGKYSWRIIYVSVSCQGVIYQLCNLFLHYRIGLELIM